MRRMRRGRLSTNIWLCLLFITMLLTLIYFWFASPELHIHNINVQQNVKNYPQYLSGSIKEDFESSSKPIPVYVVEEHHEVIPFWFGAVESGDLPRPKGITLMHIDAHSDAVPPRIDESFPSFRWPNVSEWPKFMTSNDQFIVAAALTGMFSRFTWMWPQWSFPEVTELLKFENISVNVYGGIWINKDAGKVRPIERFCVCGKVLNPPEDWNVFMKARHCIRFTTGVRSLNDLTKISLNECKSRVKLRLDAISENKMVTEMLSGRSLDLKDGSLSEGFILDIDEDYFGCEASVVPLYEVGLNQSFVDMLTSRVRFFFCGNTSDQEFAANIIFGEIVKFSKSNPDICGEENDSQNLPALCLNQLYIYLQASYFSTLDDALKLRLHDVLCEKDHVEHTLKHLEDLLVAMAPLSDKQIEAIADIGICFESSPETYGFQDFGFFHICDGNNRPNNSAVLFHSPDNKEIELRAQKLRIILNQLPSAPDIVTLCRSVRDGYTPRSKFPLIEKSIIDVLHDVFRKRGVKVKYHRNLFGGPDGWS